MTTAGSEALTPVEKKLIAQHIQTRSVYNEAENYSVRVEYKNDKLKEPRKFVLVLGNNRIYFFKPGGKLQMDMHLWDIMELRSDTPGSLDIKHRDGTTFTLVVASHRDVEDIADAVSYLWSSNFPGSSKPLKVIPPSLVSDAPVDVGPCGGFAITYLAVFPAPEIIWQCESYFGPKDITVFDCDVFGKKETVLASDFRAIMLVLMNNTYFTELIIKKAKIAGDGIAALASTLSSNIKLTKVVVSQSGLGRAECQQIVDGLSAGHSLPLTHLDLSGNPIEDKGFMAIAEYLKKHTKGLESLNLSNCGSGSKGSFAIAEALAHNDSYSHNLTHLDLSGNRLDTEATVQLSQFLQKARALSYLGLANCNVNFHELKMCSPLESLNLAGNKITKKVYMEFAKILPACPNLRVLNLAKTTPPSEVLPDIFKIALPKLRELDISDNDFSDEQLLTILEFLQSFDSLSSLHLSGNFSKSKQKHRHLLVEALGAIVARKSSPVEHLVMHSPKHPLKNDILPFLLSLIDPKIRLRSLDISGHEIGDVGACSLGKVLQTNRSLVSITWDNSATTVTGLEYFAAGLQRNQKLTEHYIPVCDVAAIIKKTGEASSTSPSVQPLIEVMQDRVNTITRESMSVFSKQMSPVLPTDYSPKIASRSLKPRKREVNFDLDIKSALVMFPESKNFTISENTTLVQNS